MAHHTGRVHHRVHHAAAYSPPSASIVVDGNTGEVLQASNADGLRHPASLTKIMTLYVLFERLEAGKIRLDSSLKISEHATSQAPTKLGIKAGQTITVEDAIKAVVTRSANDIAVAIAENLAGDEDAFAKLMTQKARALGMSRTTYVNASGLPDDDQITTARDQALLGRAIEDRFPRYYRYFSTREFVYRGQAIRNHNHLLGSVGGVDGIKTGYTRASGFNLVTSVHRDGRFIIAVVLGGRSAFERDAHMRDLISDHIKEAGVRRTAALVAERTERSQPQATAAAKAPVAERTERSQPQATAFAKAPLSSHADQAPTAAVSAPAPASPNDPIRPVLVKTVSYRTAPVAAGSLAPMPALVAVAAPQGAPAASPSRAQPIAEPSRTIVVASAEPASIASIKPDAGKAEAMKAEAPAAEPPRTEPAKLGQPKLELAKAEPPRSEAVQPEPAKAVQPEPAKADQTQPHARPRGGWQIQIGAFEGEDEARQHLSAAQLKARAALAAADAFTEPVQKGDKTLYRARFAGFDKETAENACRQLKRSDFDCMALKN
jgi:D-alanyl-D-alanine carboxypeptidase